MDYMMKYSTERYLQTGSSVHYRCEMGRENDLKKVNNWSENEDKFLPKLSFVAPFWWDIGKNFDLKNR